MPEELYLMQGRAAERILFQVLDVRGKHVLSNSCFDTTRLVSFSYCQACP